MEGGHLDVVRKLLVSDTACLPQLDWTPCGQWKGPGSHLLIGWGGSPFLKQRSRDRGQGEWILEALLCFLAHLPWLASGLALEIGILECVDLYYKIIRFLFFF